MAAKKAAPEKTGQDRSPSFSEAMSEVEAILSRLEQESVDIDELSEEVKRAVKLIMDCRIKLDRTEEEVRGLVAGLNESDQAEDSGGETTS